MVKVFAPELNVCGFEFHFESFILDNSLASSMDFLDIQTILE